MHVITEQLGRHRTVKKHHGVSANVNMSRDSHVTTDNSRMYKLLESVQEIKWMAMHFSIFQCLENRVCLYQVTFLVLGVGNGNAKA